MKKSIILLFVFLLLTVSSVFADDLEDVTKAGVLRFGHHDEYAPFVFEDNEGRTAGIDISLMEEVARRMGVKLETVPLAWDGIVDSLNLGQADVIGGGMSKTDERMEKIDFTRVYYSAEADFICLASYNKPAQVTLDSFRGLKIGVEKGSSFDQWVRKNLVDAGYVNAADVYTYSSIPEEVKALDNGKVDVVIQDQDLFLGMYGFTGKYQVFYEGFLTENYAFGLRKGSNLTAVINQHLTDMIKDGTAQGLANKFFTMNFAELHELLTRPVQPTAAPIVYATPAPVQSSCVNGMTYVADVTIPDGQTFNPGQGFRKTWRVRNNGTCTWTTDYRFELASGTSMGSNSIRVPSNVAPGQPVDLSVDMTAPAAPGSYQGNWQMRSPQGAAFGQVIWVSIRVGGNAANTGNYVKPTATPRPSDGQRRVVPQINYFYAAPDAGFMGDCSTVYWSVSNAGAVDIYVSGTQIEANGGPTGSAPVCATVQSVGTHQITLVAHSVTDDVSSTITYTTLPTGSANPQPNNYNYNYYNQGETLTEDDWMALAIIGAVVEAIENEPDYSYDYGYDSSYDSVSDEDWILLATLMAMGG